MTEYIKALASSLPRENSGYEFVCSDYIFIPIQKSRLAIIKRKVQNLSFVDEMILKFIALGITNIRELSGYMGLSKDILEISLADLYKNDYISISSKTCQIQAKGSRFLKGEKETRKERDVLNDIYVNLCTGDIFENWDDLVDNYYSHSYKFGHRIIADIDFFKKEISALKEIFENKKISMLSAAPSKSQHSEQSDEELFGIEKVNNAVGVFKRIKLNFYVSEANEVIDVIPTDSNDIELVAKLKDEIITEIINRKFLKHLLSNQVHISKPNVVPTPDYPEELKKLIKTYATSKNKDSIFARIGELILTNRELLENEFLPLIAYLTKEVSLAEIYIGKNLYFQFQSPIISNALQVLSTIEHCSIHYNSEDGFVKGSEAISRSIPKLKKDCFTKTDFSEDFKVIFDGKYTIHSVPTQTRVYKSMYINYKKYFLEVPSSE